MLGIKLRDLRLSHGLTQTELAKKLNITQGAVGMYERGERKPDIEKLEKICSFFNVTSDYLIKPSAACEEKSPYGLRPLPSLSDQELAEITALVESDPAFSDIREAFQNGSKNIKEFFALGVKMYQMEQKSKNDKL